MSKQARVIFIQAWISVSKFRIDLSGLKLEKSHWSGIKSYRHDIFQRIYEHFVVRIHVFSP